jgi:hypothetical protein
MRQRRRRRSQRARQNVDCGSAAGVGSKVVSVRRKDARQRSAASAAKEFGESGGVQACGESRLR